VTDRLRIRVQGFIGWSPRGWSETHRSRSSLGKTEDVGGATKASAQLVWIRLTRVPCFGWTASVVHVRKRWLRWSSGLRFVLSFVGEAVWNAIP
jgi:hypothetical protein